MQQNLCCAICLRTTRRHWRTTGATKDMKNPRMYADLGDCLHFDGLRWKSYCLGSVFAARIPVRCPFGASCAATRHRCSLSAFLNKSVEPAGSHVAQTAKQKNPHKAGHFVLAGRLGNARPVHGPRPSAAAPGPAPLRCAVQNRSRRFCRTQGFEPGLKQQNKKATARVAFLFCWLGD